MEHSKYWVEQAEYDLETAIAMQKTGRYLYVGFMCQQTVEKALKAVIAKQGTFPPKTHDLVRLVGLAGISDLLSEEQNRLLDDLYPLNVEARYPSDKEKLAKALNKVTCGKFITETGAMLKWIKEKFIL